MYWATVCARIASNVLSDAIGEGDTSADRLSEYDRRWRQEIGSELSKGLKLANFGFSMDDTHLERIIDSLSDNHILDVINEYGDMDAPVELAYKLLKGAGIRGMGGLLWSVLRSVI
ncbi:MAG: NAD(P)/FAD-dependent oxidoreductase [Methermicoccaceae archaeon]